MLALIYALDRALRLLALRAFFRRPAPPAPATRPAVTLIHPVTRAGHDLRRSLASRAAQDYPGPQHHIFVCDRDDADSQAIVRELIARNPGWSAELRLADPDSGPIASKLLKIAVAAPESGAELLCFVDDDVALSPDALTTLVRHLGAPGVGAAFGLARYTAHETAWSSLMSLFVNTAALPSYVPLTFLAEPFTITGHCFALRRDVFLAAGGFSGMAGRIDDDHELARRVRALGLRCVQTPLIYDVENRLPTARAYAAQLKRWFVFPRETMLPQLTRRERIVTGLGSAGNLLPPLAALRALVTRRPRDIGAALACLALFLAAHARLEARYLGRVTPARRLPLLLVVALLTPLHVLAASLGDSVVEWRGLRIRVRRGGSFELLSCESGRASLQDGPDSQA